MLSGNHLLFLFLDGVGLGEGDPDRNPLCAARMPVLTALLGKGWYLRKGGRIVGERASLAPTDACLGVPGRPQSATGQATLLTGLNVPKEVGGHFGPKPTPEIANLVRNGNLFSRVISLGGSALFMNPYPPGFFQGIFSGRRLLSAVQLAVQSSGLELLTHHDLMAGRAVSPDFTGEGWRQKLGYSETPQLSLEEAGYRMARLTQSHSLVFFDYWLTDLCGHRQDFKGAVELLERLDRVLGGILSVWDWSAGAILVTSDHGNLEDVAISNHTLNPVPTIAIGKDHELLTANVQSLLDITPSVLRFLKA